MLTTNWKIICFNSVDVVECWFSTHYSSLDFSLTSNFPLQTIFHSVCCSFKIWNNGFCCARQRMRSIAVSLSEKFKFKFYSNKFFRLLSIYYRNNMYCYCSSMCIANNHHIVHNGYIIHANLFSVWRARDRTNEKRNKQKKTCRSTEETKWDKEHLMKFTFEISQDSAFQIMWMHDFYKCTFSFGVAFGTKNHYQNRNLNCWNNEHAFNATKMRFKIIGFYF